MKKWKEVTSCTRSFDDSIGQVKDDVEGQLATVAAFKEQMHVGWTSAQEADANFKTAAWGVAVEDCNNEHAMLENYAEGMMDGSSWKNVGEFNEHVFGSVLVVAKKGSNETKGAHEESRSLYDICDGQPC